MYKPEVQRTEISANIFGALHLRTPRPIFFYKYYGAPHQPITYFFVIRFFSRIGFIYFISPKEVLLSHLF
jgi:hypothetical protein